ASPRARAGRKARGARPPRLAACGRARGGGCELDPGRAARADLHVLPSGARSRGAGRAHAAAAGRPDDGGERPRLPRPRGDEPEPAGLLALILLHDARREARMDEAGEPVLLEEQDRTRFDRERVEDGKTLLEAALRRRRPGPYQVQAAIAALHTEPATDWPQ